MRSREARIDRLANAVDVVDVDTAAVEARQRIAADNERDSAPAPILAALWELMILARHEAAHAHYAMRRGWKVPRCSLRADGTGVTIVEGAVGTDYETEVHRIVFTLVGLAHDLRESADTPLHCYDTVAARLKVDALNARQAGPVVTFQHVAELAVAFVDENFEAIENIGLVLYHSRELIHADVELFGRCAR